MSLHIIENDVLRVTVSDAGAELISVFDKEKDTERIWIGDPAVWNRHAPILFPFVGKVMDGKYRIADKEYTMKTQRGFALDMEFACVEETSASVTHGLSMNSGSPSPIGWMESSSSSNGVLRIMAQTQCISLSAAIPAF